MSRMTGPEIIQSIAALRARVGQWRAAGESVALAPTMGALHDGHISLVELARARARRVVVSVFVNPAQFAPNEDFAQYPRPFEADVARLSGAGADVVFHPDVAEMYPEGFATAVVPAGPASAGLEDKFRPTHFQGVATVVTKLLLQCLPDVAVFGEKDFQQLAMIRRLTRDLDLPVEIIGAPTLREADGLALSSRNAYLDPAERKRAATLNQAMRWAADRFHAGEPLEDVLRDSRASISAAGFLLDYLEARDAASLAPPAPDQRAGLRMLAAGRLGRTRLIDNIPLGT